MVGRPYIDAGHEARGLRIDRVHYIATDRIQPVGSALLDVLPGCLCLAVHCPLLGQVERHLERHPGLLDLCQLVPNVQAWLLYVLLIGVPELGENSHTSVSD